MEPSMFVPTPPLPSPEAEDLGLQIADLVRLYREEHPEIGRHEVDQAFALARRSLREGTPDAAARPLAISLILGLAFAAGLAVLLLRGANVGPNFVLMVVIALIAAGLAVITIVRRLG
jgi:hypothetical protein